MSIPKAPALTLRTFLALLPCFQISWPTPLCVRPAWLPRDTIQQISRFPPMISSFYQLSSVVDEPTEISAFFKTHHPPPLLTPDSWCVRNFFLNKTKNRTHHLALPPSQNCLVSSKTKLFSSKIFQKLPVVTVSIPLLLSNQFWPALYPPR